MLTMGPHQPYIQSKSGFEEREQEADHSLPSTAEIFSVGYLTTLSISRIYCIGADAENASIFTRTPKYSLIGLMQRRRDNPVFSRQLLTLQQIHFP
jgi:hypothetical protein